MACFPDHRDGCRLVPRFRPSRPVVTIDRDILMTEITEPIFTLSLPSPQIHVDDQILIFQQSLAESHTSPHYGRLL